MRIVVKIYLQSEYKNIIVIVSDLKWKILFVMSTWRRVSQSPKDC